MKSFIAVSVSSIILAALIIAVCPVHAKPYYTSGDHIIKLVVKFQNDCWDEIYARATPKNNNHVLLNYQYVKNNDEPDNGPSEIIKLSLKFKEKKMEQTQETNENKIRTYVSIELVGEVQGETVTKYLTFNAGKKTIDFGVFQMKTNPELCQ